MVPVLCVMYYHWNIKSNNIFIKYFLFIFQLPPPSHIRKVKLLLKYLIDFFLILLLWKLNDSFFCAKRCLTASYLPISSISSELKICIKCIYIQPCKMGKLRKVNCVVKHCWNRVGNVMLQCSNWFLFLNICWSVLDVGCVM